MRFTNTSFSAGFNVETVEYKNISFTVWDVGGQDKVFIPPASSCLTSDIIVLGYGWSSKLSTILFVDLYLKCTTYFDPRIRKSATNPRKKWGDDNQLEHKFHHPQPWMLLLDRYQNSLLGNQCQQTSWMETWPYVSV